MLRVIEDLGDVVIQKVVRPKDGSTIRYQTVAKKDIGNAEKVVVSHTLQHARETAGSGLLIPKSLLPTSKRDN